MPRAYLNPFYLLSVVIGIAFLITAFAYGVMAFRGSTPDLMTESADPSTVMGFLSRYGLMLFLIELGALMLTTVAAIVLDDFFNPNKNSDQQPSGDSENESSEIAGEEPIADSQEPSANS